jgi:Flp pilus assembly protein TadD
VRASDIADKEVILRVLAMYQDPEEREQQIRNMSHGFQELADGILPELRRARLTINYETIGRSDQQIADQLKSDASQLSVEELLYAASKAPNVQEQKQVYRTVAQQYPNDVRAYNNLAAIALTSGNQEEARQWLEKARQIDGSNAEVNANLGLLALLQGNIQAAEGFIGRAAHADNLAETLGNLHLAQGNYALAEHDFGNVCSNSAALAQLLNKNYAKAEQTLKSVKTPNGLTDYLRAVVSARQGNKEAAAGLLRSALQKDPSLQKYADNDLELK